MAGAPPPFLASLQALWEAPLDEVASVLLVAVVAPMLQREPYPMVGDSAFERVAIETLPETANRGFAMGPEFGMARQVVREALALLEVNLLVNRQHYSSGSDSVRLTRRGHVAIASGDVGAALTIAR